MALTYQLDSRTRRAWIKTLMEKQEAVEIAQAALDEAIVTAYKAGMSYANIGGALSLHATTIEKKFSGINKGDQGGSDGSQ